MDLYLDKVRLFEIAISSRNGSIDFHPSNGDGSAKEWDRSGSIRRPKNHLFDMIGLGSITPYRLKLEGLTTAAAKPT
ncbi:hypothetical protein MES4922_180069 [Mesorhizobium ventifaucium]|uniref:Uncharacterized protein n=1 Tax=Mesorhizobium ventifaucium TaxID=666020 RepID=A0ABN8JM28_9HYPH|nr:hypothetical protein MES4922_180069 [Mesorhizobium ventifaucium]